MELNNSRQDHNLLSNIPANQMQKRCRELTFEIQYREVIEPKRRITNYRHTKKLEYVNDLRPVMIMEKYAQIEQPPTETKTDIIDETINHQTASNITMKSAVDDRRQSVICKPIMEQSTQIMNNTDEKVNPEMPQNSSVKPVGDREQSVIREPIMKQYTQMKKENMDNTVNSQITSNTSLKPAVSDREQSVICEPIMKQSTETTKKNMDQESRKEIIQNKADETVNFQITSDTSLKSGVNDREQSVICKPIMKQSTQTIQKNMDQEPRKDETVNSQITLNTSLKSGVNDREQSVICKPIMKQSTQIIQKNMDQTVSPQMAKTALIKPIVADRCCCSAIPKILIEQYAEIRKGLIANKVDIPNILLNCRSILTNCQSVIGVREQSVICRPIMENSTQIRKEAVDKIVNSERERSVICEPIKKQFVQVKKEAIVTNREQSVIPKKIMEQYAQQRKRFIANNIENSVHVEQQILMNMEDEKPSCSKENGKRKSDIQNASPHPNKKRAVSEDKENCDLKRHQTDSVAKRLRSNFKNMVAASKLMKPEQTRPITMDPVLKAISKKTTDEKSNLKKYPCPRDSVAKRLRSNFKNMVAASKLMNSEEARPITMDPVLMAISKKAAAEKSNLKIYPCPRDPKRRGTKRQFNKN